MDDRSGYPLHFYASDVEPNEHSNSSKFEQLAQHFQNHLAQPIALHELPPDIDDFVGRSTEVRQVLQRVHQSIPGKAPETIVITITGRAGIGKSALAIHLAHRLRSSFLDAQFYVNCYGTEQYPQRSTEIVTELLRCQGIDGDRIPIDETERLQLFQSVLDNKPIILILDNVVDETQLDSLIPRNSSGVVLITSRKPLRSIEAAIDLDLTELTELEAVELLHKLINQDSIHLTLNLAREIVQVCCRSPLAIRLIAGVLKQHFTPIDAIEYLRGESQRLQALHLNHREIRPGFMLSYQQLDSKTAQLLRLLGLLSESHFTLPIAAELLEVGLDQAGQRVGHLVDLKLVRRIGGGHYSMVHDIVRLLARGVLAAEESMAVRQTVRLRVFRWYLNTCQLMALGLNPQTRRALAQAIVHTRRQPLAKIEQYILSNALSWFEMERLSILTAIEWAFQAEAWGTVVAFAESLVLFFDSHLRWFDWEQTHRLALESARRLADRQKEAELLNNLGNGCLRQNKLDRAQDYYRRSIAIFQELGARAQVAKTMVNLGMLYLQLGQRQTTVELWKDALIHLPEFSAEQQALKQWMQVADAMLWQHLNDEISDRSSAAPSSRGLLQSMGDVIKRLILE